MSSPISKTRRTAWLAGLLLGLPTLGILALMWWWDYEPDTFDVAAHAKARAAERGQPVVVGSTSAETLIRVAETLLDKRGGYLSNDMLPPGLIMDNVPNWEFGVLVQTRDFAKAFRNEFSRSQTQSTEDLDLLEADPLFSTPSDRWLLPSSEGQYRKAIWIDFRTRIPTAHSSSPVQTTWPIGWRWWRSGSAHCRSGCLPASARFA
jgi:hypothetical protein